MVPTKEALYQGELIENLVLEEFTHLPSEVPS
jgi:hypothetical protein